MAGERYVALGLAAVRSEWFLDMSRWSTMGSIPVEFVKCVSADELRARLGSGRPFSVAIIDSSTGAVDRDLIDLASNCSVPILLVDPDEGTDWKVLGIAGVLAPTFTREQVLEALSATSRMIGGATLLPTTEDPTLRPADRRGTLITVTGSGGTGASTVAMALAQAWGDDAATAPTLLADLRLLSEQAMLHDARDIVPGLQELVEAHRSTRPDDAQVVALTFDVATRGYRLLLGLRRQRDWTVLRPRAVDASFDGLQRTFATIVADADHDVEGEAETGSVEIEERNLLARTAARRAAAVVVVGRPGVKGTHSLVRVLNGFRSFGVPPGRTLAVVNGLGRNPRSRAEHARTIADLTGASAGLPPVIGPVFLTPRRNLEQIHRDGTRLPTGWVAPVATALSSLLERADQVAPGEQPTAIVPGSLGAWSAEEATG